MPCCISVSFLLTNAFSACFENHYEKNIQYESHSEILSRLVNLKCAPPSRQSSWTVMACIYIVYKIHWRLNC